VAWVWRLAQPEFAADIGGERNATTGARWNSPGNGVLYASFNLPLSVLEAFVHLPPALRINLPEMTAIRIHLPDETPWSAIDLSQLPADLEGKAAQVRCRQLGDAWIAGRETLACTIPSIIIPRESNLMVNPAHPLMSKVKIVETERFRFDARLAMSSRSV
jgi:RES domain-containing protein